MRPEINNDRCLLPAGAKDDAPAWLAHRTVFFASGRESVLALLRALPKVSSQTNTVLLPAYVPEGLIAPCRTAGYHVVQYPIDEFLCPNWAAVSEMLQRYRPRVSVIVHYFGLVQDASRFVAMSHEVGTLVIEDLAHVMQPPDGNLGRVGDFVTYSLPKMIGVPDGAPLEVRTSALDIETLRYHRDPRHAAYVLIQTILLGCNTLSRRVLGPQIWRPLRAVYARILRSYTLLKSYYHRPTRMSRWGRRLLRRVPWSKTILHRKSLENLYHRELDSSVFRQFPRAPNRLHCGMGYPVRVDDRASLVRYLHERGISGVYFAYGWHFIPDGPEYESSRTIMREHFLFPTAASLTIPEVSLVIQIANQWASEHHRARTRDDASAYEIPRAVTTHG